MTAHPGAIPAWNLVLRFVLELAAFAGFGWAGWHLAGWPLAIAMPIAAMAAWGVFAVPDDPSRNGKAVVAVPGWIRLGLELLIFFGGAIGFAAYGVAVAGGLLAALTVVHLAFSVGRTKWLLRQPE